MPDVIRQVLQEVVVAGAEGAIDEVLLGIGEAREQARDRGYGVAWQVPNDILLLTSCEGLSPI